MSDPSATHVADLHVPSHKLPPPPKRGATLSTEDKERLVEKASTAQQLHERPHLNSTKRKAYMQVLDDIERRRAREGRSAARAERRAQETQQRQRLSVAVLVLFALTLIVVVMHWLHGDQSSSVSTLTGLY